MTSGQKVAVSLLASVVLFAVFTVVAFAGLFGVVETKFHQPRVTSGIEERLEKISDAQNRYVESLFKKFESFISDESVRTYLESRPDDNAVQKREKLRVNLMMDTRALRGIRVIDPVGINILYSSFSSDVMSSSANKVTYKKYSDLTSAKVDPEMHYADLKVGDIRTSNYGSVKKNRVYLDEHRNRAVFSMPFYDSSEKYAGTVAFYCDPGDLSRFLFEENLIDITGYGFLITDSDGFGGYVFGLSNVGRTSLQKLILEQWSIDSRSNSQTGSSSFTVRNIVPELDSKNDSDRDAASKEINENSDDIKILFSKKSSRDDLGFMAWIYDKNIMFFPQSVKILLLALTFVTLFLIIYLVFNLRHDDMVIIKKRIKQFQLSFVTESLENLDGKTKKVLNFEEKKDRINAEIKNSLGNRGKKYSKEIDELLDASWNDIFIAMGLRPDGKVSAVVDSEELKRILEEVLGSGNVKINAVSIKKSVVESAETSTTSLKKSESETAEEVDESEPVEDADSVEEIEEADSVEEIEEAETAEEVDEPESVEDADSVEEIEEVETAEEVDESEPVEDVDSVEEIEEVETAEEVDESEPVEDADSVEEIEEVENAEEVYESEPVENVDSVEEIEEAETAEEVDESEPVEDVDSVEEIEEVENAEEVDESEPVEDADSVEDVSISEFIDDIEEFESAETQEDYIPLVASNEYDKDEYEILEELEDMEATSFGVKSANYNFNSDPDFKEPLTFSCPEVNPTSVEDAEGDNIVENFTTKTLDFSNLDELPIDERGDDASYTLDENKTFEHIEEVESLDLKSGSKLFSFTGLSSLENASDVVSE